MTEAEWLSSDDPKKMLDSRSVVTTGSFAPGGVEADRHSLISDRKLRLFICACNLALPIHERNPNLPNQWYNGEPDGDEMSGRAARALATAKTWVLSPSAGEGVEIPGRRDVLKVRARLLHDIVGNPFRPVTLPKVPFMPAAMMPDGKWVRLNAEGKYEEANHCPWLTPTVLSLATAAYEERPSRECEKCTGTGTVGGYFGDNITTPVDYDEYDCPDCHGTGRIGDGTLDPVRLMILADALEEAGCDSEELLRHLRGEERCPHCGPGVNLYGPPCKHCGGTGKNPNIHVRGCHVVDLILGKE